MSPGERVRCMSESLRATSFSHPETHKSKFSTVFHVFSTESVEKRDAVRSGFVHVSPVCNLLFAAFETCMFHSLKPPSVLFRPFASNLASRDLCPNSPDRALF